MIDTQLDALMGLIPTPGLECDENHIYTFGGRVVPGLTQILNVEGFIDQHGTDYHRERGTKMHKIIELFERDKLDMDSVDETLKPKLDEWINFLTVSGWQTFASEVMLYNFKLDYATRLDMVGHMNDKAWIMELKTGDVPAWANLQTAGQELALRAQYPDGLRGYPIHRMGLNLTTGIPVYFQDMQDLADFMAIHRTFTRRNGNGN